MWNRDDVQWNLNQCTNNSREENETENVVYINVLIDIPCIVLTADKQSTSQTDIPT